MPDTLAPPAPIAFIDLAAQHARIADRVRAAIGRVLDHGGYIMGPEVRKFEDQLAAFVGVKHAISCANGTDALLLGLMAKGVGPGDALLVPSFTFAATAEAVALLGATPVFVDVAESTFNLDPASLAVAIADAKAAGLRLKGVIPVDLFGLPADYDAIDAVVRPLGLFVLEDAAQSLGARYRGRVAGALGDIGATSFFPAKPLGCYGDGGAVFTDDDALAAGLRSLRVHGQGTDKYDNVRIGLNARLDTIQAAVLIEKLAIFDDEIARRQRVADRYTDGLDGVVAVPRVPAGYASVWAQYTVLVDDREHVAAALKAEGIPTAVYYPLPLHRQTAYRGFPCASSGLPASERLARRVLSLPMHPYLETDVQDRIIAALRRAVR